MCIYLVFHFLIFLNELWIIQAMTVWITEFVHPWRLKSSNYPITDTAWKSLHQVSLSHLTTAQGSSLCMSPLLSSSQLVLSLSFKTSNKADSEDNIHERPLPLGEVNCHYQTCSSKKLNIWHMIITYLSLLPQISLQPHQREGHKSSLSSSFYFPVSPPLWALALELIHLSTHLKNSVSYLKKDKTKTGRSWVNHLDIWK